MTALHLCFAFVDEALSSTLYESTTAASTASSVWVRRWLALPGVSFATQFSDNTECLRFDDGTLISCTPSVSFVPTPRAPIIDVADALQDRRC